MKGRPTFAAMVAILLAMGIASPTLAQTDAVRFHGPQSDGLLLDWCKGFGKRCGQPAADAFCRAEGYRRSVRFVQLVDPGKPTRIIGTGEVCSDPGCDSFRWIECRK